MISIKLTNYMDIIIRNIMGHFFRIEKLQYYFEMQYYSVCYLRYITL